MANAVTVQELGIPAAGTGEDYPMSLRCLRAGEVDREMHVAAAIAMVRQMQNREFHSSRGL